MTDRTHGRTTILTVDDDRVLRRFIASALSEEFHVLTAASGEEALETLGATATPPDLVLLDIVMPGIDGYETCRRIRENPRTAQTKVILVSGMTRSEERLHGYACGADDYLTKPIEIEELLAKARVFRRLKTVEGIERIKTDLLTVLDHEIRGPLCGILPPSEMLATSEEIGEENRVMLAETILASGRRLLKLTERGLLYCRLQEDAADIHIETFDATTVMRRLADRSSTDVQWGVPGDALEIEYDPNLFATMTEAVVDGARTFLTPIERSEVALTPQSATELELTWWFAGPQVTEEQSRHAFEFLGNRVVDGETVGSDVSMALAQSIAQRFGATITIETQPGGTRLRLPVRRRCPVDAR